MSRGEKVERADASWRAARDHPGWYNDIGWQLQDVLTAHHYRSDRPGTEKVGDPGWHPCTCGWEGYWSAFKPHVADHLREVVIRWAANSRAVTQDAMVVVATAIEPNWNKGAAVLERLVLDQAERVLIALGIAVEDE